MAKSSPEPKNRHDFQGKEAMTVFFATTMKLARNLGWSEKQMIALFAPDNITGAYRILQEEETTHDQNRPG